MTQRPRDVIERLGRDALRLKIPLFGVFAYGRENAYGINPPHLHTLAGKELPALIGRPLRTDYGPNAAHSRRITLGPVG